MDDNRKSKMIIVLIANLALAGGVLLAIWNGGDSSRGKKPAAPAHDGVSPSALNPAGQPPNASAAVSQKDGLATTISAEHGEAGKTEEHPASLRGAMSREESTPAALKKIPVPAPPPISPGVALSELPPPPDPPGPPLPVGKRAGNSAKKRFAGPLKVSGIKLTAIIGSKAMLALRREGSSRNERPEIVCLSIGEHVLTSDNVLISVVSVEPDHVILEVGGERFIKSLPAIR